MDEHYKANAMNIAKTAASQMDGDKIGDYITRLEHWIRRMRIIRNIFRRLG
jgi:hypothetical protein